MYLICLHLMVMVLLFFEPLLGVWNCTKYLTSVILLNSLDSFRSKKVKAELEPGSFGYRGGFHPFILHSLLGFFFKK